MKIRALLGRGSDKPAATEAPAVRSLPAPPAACDSDSAEPRSSDRWYVPGDADPARFLAADGSPALHLIPYTDSAQERVLRLVEDRTGLLLGPTHRGLSRAGIYVSQLRGETYHEAACRRGNFSPGASVRLVREPDNPHDPNAVAVYDATGRYHAAYIDKQKARTLARLLDASTCLEAIAIRGTPAGKPCDQIAILAASPLVLAALSSPRPRQFPQPAHLR